MHLKVVPAPSAEEMNSLYAELNNCKFKHVALSLVPSFTESFVLNKYTNPGLPSQSLIRSICYPELNKVFSKATMHGGKHEGLAISAYEHVVKEKHKNFKIVKCGMSINKEYPGYMLPQTFSVLVTVVGKGVEMSSVPFALTVVTLKAMFLKVCPI